MMWQCMIKSSSAERERWFAETPYRAVFRITHIFLNLTEHESEGEAIMQKLTNRKHGDVEGHC